MPQKEDVLVVPVEKYAFRKAKEEGFYACPESNNRKVKDYIAFHRVSPISAITHYTKVQSVEITDELNSKYRLMTFGDRMEEKARVVKFGELKKLDSPIEHDKLGMQGGFYTRLDKLKNASVFSDL